MMAYKSAAKMFRDMAKKSKEEQDFKKAAEYYNNAALEYKTSYDNAKSEQEKEFFRGEYNTCVKQMKECKNPVIEYVVPEHLKPKVVTRPNVPLSPGSTGNPAVPYVTSLEGLVDSDNRPIKIEKRKPKHDFSAVGGMDELKETFYINIIDSFVSPCDLDKIGGSNTQSYILYGPPGCGKTFVLEAMVGELNKELKKTGKKEAVFIEADISNIKQKYVGESEKYLKAYFEEAVKNAPCVLFFDELDSLGQQRSSDDGARHSSELLTSFLKDFELLKKKDVIIVGATNRPGSLDSALTRPDRFGDNLILVPNPDYNARREIFRVGIEKNKKVAEYSENINIDKLAELTEGYSSVDIDTICNKDIKTNAKKKRRQTGKIAPISQDDFVEAIEGRESSLKRWVSEIKKDMIDMSIYKHKQTVEFKAGKSEYFDLLQLAFAIEGKQIVNHNGVYRVIPIKKFTPDDVIDDSSDEGTDAPVS